MNKVFRRIVSMSLASALIMSASTAALAAEIDETPQNDAAVNFRQEIDENGDIMFDVSNMPTGALDVDIDEIDDAHKISSVEEYKEFAGISDSRKKNAAPCAETLPDEVDNSTNENAIYFPRIDTQGQIGSCVAWATTYYNYTYTANKARGVVTTPENTYSPMWTYNLANGINNEGTNASELLGKVKRMGIATVADVPLQNSTTPESNYRSWHAQGDIWEHALHNRISDYSFFTCKYYYNGQYLNSATPYPPVGTPITDAKDADLDTMKTALSSGSVLFFNSYIGGWRYKNIKHSNSVGVDNSHCGEYVAYVNFPSSPGHGMTIVGYNDNIWTDINENDTIDDGEMGAFKIANSWGEEFCNDGFCWVAYDALNEISSVPGYSITNKRISIFGGILSIYVEDKDYSSNSFIKYTLNSANRYDTYLIISATDKKTGYTYSHESDPFIARYTGSTNPNQAYNFNGEVGLGDGTMYFDLNNLFPQYIDYSPDIVSDYDWKITVHGENAGCPVTIKELKFVNKENGVEYDLLGDSYVTINNTDRVFTANDIDLGGEEKELDFDLTLAPEMYAAPSTVTLNASAHGGKAPYQYSFEAVHNYYENVLNTGYISSSSVSVPVNANGAYKYTVSVKDANGTVVTKTKWDYPTSYSLNDLDTGSGVVSAEESGVVGQQIKFTPKSIITANALTAANYKYTITKDGISTEYSADPTDFSLAWTPTESGVYTVNCKVTYNSATLTERTETVTVEDAPANVVTIYYKGFNTPNIHYRTGYGSWTNAPGVAMIPDTSVEGCTHSYTIDLGSETFAEVCFNDGNGHWDSRNGENYRFTNGTYKFENGTFTPINVNSFTATLSVPGNVLLAGDTMNISCSVHGGTAPYTYQFVRKPVGFDEYIIKDYSSDNNMDLTCYTAYSERIGDSVIIVNVMDANGNIATASETVTYKRLSAEIKADKTNAAPGETVKLSLNTNGTFHTAYLKYSVYDGENWTELTTNSDNTADWTPVQAGEYQIKCVINNDATNYAITYTMNYTVESAPANTVTIYYNGYSNPNIHYQVGNGSWTNVPGVAMTPNNEIAGYTHKYTIDLGNASYTNVCFNDGHGNWDSRNGANYRFTKGTYTFSNGTITAM